MTVNSLPALLAAAVLAAGFYLAGKAAGRLLYRRKHNDSKRLS